VPKIPKNKEGEVANAKLSFEKGLLVGVTVKYSTFDKRYQQQINYTSEHTVEPALQVVDADGKLLTGSLVVHKPADFVPHIAIAERLLLTDTMARIVCRHGNVSLYNAPNAEEAFKAEVTVRDIPERSTPLAPSTAATGETEAPAPAEAPEAAAG